MKTEFGQVVTIENIKTWGTAQREAGQPSGLKDFFRVNNCCCICRGRKYIAISMSPILWEPCPRCVGTGAYCESAGVVLSHAQAQYIVAKINECVAELDRLESPYVDRTEVEFAMRLILDNPGYRG